MAAARVRTRHGGIARGRIRRLAGLRLDQSARRPPLQLRHIAQRRAAVDQLLHALHKRVRAQENLAAQRLPNRRQSNTCPHEIDVLCHCAVAPLAKMRQQPIGFQPRRRRLHAHHRRVAAPGPVGHVAHDARAHRVKHHVARDLEQVALALHQDGLEPALEHMPHLAMPAVEALRIHTIELAHPGRQVRLGRFDQHVEVVAHQAPRVAPPVEPRAHLAQNRQPLGSIQVVDIDRFAAVTARGDVIKRLRKLKT